MNEISKYRDAVVAIKTAILQGQYEAAKGVNRIQLAVYFGVGKYLSLNTRKGVWGTGALESISSQLQREMPGLRGFSATSLKKMRLFYDNWNILDDKSSVTTDEIRKPNPSDATDDLSAQSATTYKQDIGLTCGMKFPNLQTFPVEDFFNTPFSHHVEIYTRTNDLDERCYYIRRCAEEHLSVGRLKRLMDDDAFHHQAEMPNNFGATLPAADMARKAVMMFKDEYMLDFINTEEIGERDAEDIDERVVEKEIVHNIKKFIMTFGHDFAFIGNQYHLEVYSEEFFPDLLFFNRELNAMIVVELKTGKFKPSYLGQLTTYLRILDDKVRKPHENPTMGIVLCKSADKEFVEYVIQDYDKPMGVATYSTSRDMPEKLRHALPDVEELKKLLDTGR